ncbi:MAG: D-Ala-D-Ala carboxypeptidase family metallohydrolase [Pseudomonadota bacterium]
MTLKSGKMTSGRRTPEGNKAVGGVPNSAHLQGRAVDYWGPDLNVTLAEARRIPGMRKAFIHKNHVHGEGDFNVPYFGKNGTRGLKR